jgi:acetyl-CoA synthetase
MWAWWKAAMWTRGLAAASPDCPPEEMNAEDPLFILYTSGSTGKPKGVLHTTGGYCVWAQMTHRYVFDYRPGQIYWCAADVGWVTGHSYLIYGPLMNGGTTLMFEGVPNYPDPSRFWQVVDKYQVEIFYGAPTALRALMREGDEWVHKTSRKAARAGQRGRAHQPRSLAMVSQGDRRRPLPHRRHLVADRNRRRDDQPHARRHRAEAGQRHAPMFGVQPLLLDNDGIGDGRPGDGCLVIAIRGRARCAACGATRNASSPPISPPLPAITSPATAAAATRTAITGSPAASTM